MQCSQCGHENPFGNFFCGHCGSPLLQRPAAPQQNVRDTAPLAPEAASQPEGSITGPSFLGLSEQQTDESRTLDYLYEDEPRHHYGRLLVAILVLAGFGAFIAYQWKQRPNWYTALNNPFSRPAAQAPIERASSEVPPSPAGNDSVPKGNAGASTQTPAPAAMPPSDSAAQSSASPPSAQPTAQSSVPQADPEQSAVEPHGDAPSPGAAPATDEGSALLTRGLAYLNGTGVPRSCSQALVYLSSAARRGNAKANSQLGGLYATGHCVPMDRARAYQYFTRARDADHGRNVYIEHNRQMLWSQMSDAEKAQARASQ